MRARAAVSSTRRRRLLEFDRKLGARFVAGADEAGRGSLAGPLVVAGVLSTTRCLRDHRVPAARVPERLEAAHAGRSARSSSAPSSAARSDRRTRRSRRARSTATACTARTSTDCARSLARADAAGGGLPRRRLPARPDGARAHGGRRRRHEERRDRRGVDRREGVRDRAMRRIDALYPALRVLVARRLHHAAALGGRARARAVAVHRRSFQALCYLRRGADAPGSRRMTAGRAPSGGRVGSTGCAATGSWRERLGRRLRARPRRAPRPARSSSAR